MRHIRPLRRAELPANTIALARYLIGKTLVYDLPQGRLAARIVETEAYVPGDAAGHAYIGRTPRNRSLFLERGHAYVYFVYGCWFMLNVSSERPGIGAGVLLRAVEPLEGIPFMQKFAAEFARKLGKSAVKKRSNSAQLRNLTRGPGRLASALRINRSLDGLDLCATPKGKGKATGPLWLGAAVRRAGPIGASVRIGLTREAHRPLRFYEHGNPLVSGPARLRS